MKPRESLGTFLMIHLQILLETGNTANAAYGEGGDLIQEDHEFLIVADWEGHNYGEPAFTYVDPDGITHRLIHTPAKPR